MCNLNRCRGCFRFMTRAQKCAHDVSVLLQWKEESSECFKYWGPFKQRVFDSVSQCLFWKVLACDMWHSKFSWLWCWAPTQTGCWHPWDCLSDSSRAWLQESQSDLYYISTPLQGIILYLICVLKTCMLFVQTFLDKILLTEDILRYGFMLTWKEAETGQGSSPRSHVNNMFVLWQTGGREGTAVSGTKCRVQTSFSSRQGVTRVACVTEEWMCHRSLVCVCMCWKHLCSEVRDD